MAQILEVIMVISFGAAWPVSIRNSYRARTAKGKSPFFLSIIIFGYINGILAKFISGNINYVVIFYMINTIMVSIDLCIYFRNRKLDRQGIENI